MTQNTIAKKCLIVGIILLFLMIGFSPIINAQDNTKLTPIGTVPITVLEYRPDGTVEKTVVRMPREQADNFHQEMTDAKDLDTRLSIYKKYNLIPQNVTADTLQAGMQEKTQRIGLTQDKLERMAKNNRTLFNRHLYVDFFCSVSGIDTISFTGYGWSYKIIPFGSSLFTLFINGRWAGPDLISFDVLDYIIGELNFESKGILGSVDGSFNGLIKIVGFVGFMYHFMDWVGHGMKVRQAFDGFAAYIRATGTFY
ncbi:MAG: hypothetical protein NTV74_03790 [Euryarchaeota archaeon]|nr:hypothetical protein [Euryarchaeota archaeon]